jgi:hypothetical protein
MVFLSPKATRPALEHQKPSKLSFLDCKTSPHQRGPGCSTPAAIIKYIDPLADTESSSFTTTNLNYIRLIIIYKGR